MGIGKRSELWAVFLLLKSKESSQEPGGRVGRAVGGNREPTPASARLGLGILKGPSGAGPGALFFLGHFLALAARLDRATEKPPSSVWGGVTI